MIAWSFSPVRAEAADFGLPLVLGRAVFPREVVVVSPEGLDGPRFELVVLYEVGCRDEEAIASCLMHS